MATLKRWIPALLATSLCAGCANKDGGGTGGDGGTTTTGTGTTSATETCTLTPTGSYLPGAFAAVASATSAQLPQSGEEPAVATNGTVHFAVWTRGSSLLGARLDQDGAPLDVPPRLLRNKLYLYRPTVVWDGAAFVVAWTEASEIWTMRVGADGAPLGEPAPLPSGPQASTPALASHDGVTLLVWTEQGTSSLRGIRLGADGGPLDAAAFPIAASANGGVQVAWDGASFVVAWADLQAGEIRAARVASGGQVLDPDGALVAASGRLPTITGTESGSVIGWVEEYSTLFVTRLSTTLVPEGPAPVQIDSVPPDYEAISWPRLSRSASGALAIGWVVEDDTGGRTAQVRALAGDLSPLGGTLSTKLAADGTQVFAGLAGADHLVVRAAEAIHAAHLTGSEQGLTDGVAHPIFLLGLTQQEGPAAAGNAQGYMAIWREENGAKWALRARPLDLDATPTGTGSFDLGEVAHGWPALVATGGEDYLVLRRRPGPFLDLLGVSPTGGLVDTIPLVDTPITGAGLACSGATCLVVWAENVQQVSSLFALRVDPAGAALDPEPVLLAHPEAPFYGDLSVVAAGGGFGVFWSTGAVRVDPSGVVTETPAFVMKGATKGLPLAGAPTSLLAVRREEISGAPSKDWLHVLGLDGTIKAEYAPLDYLATPHAVTWDGSAYLFLSTEDRAFLLTEEGTLAAPAEGIEIAQAHNGALASSTPGRAAMLTTQLTPENGLRRIFAQSLNRSDAAICDP